MNTVVVAAVVVMLSAVAYVILRHDAQPMMESYDANVAADADAVNDDHV